MAGHSAGTMTVDVDRAASLPRRLERLIRSAWLRLLVATHGGFRALPPPSWETRPHRVLLLRHDGIGDLIVSLPLIDAITRAHPALALDVLASRANAPLLQGHGRVRDVIVHDRAHGSRATMARLRDGGYDAVIDGRVVTEGVNPHVTRLMLATRAPYRIGLAGRRDDWIYTLPARPNGPLVHLVDYLAELAVPFGVDRTSARTRPMLTVREDERVAAHGTWTGVAGDGTRLLVNLSAGNVDRRWPDERFLAVLASARAAHPRAKILVIGLTADEMSASRIAIAVQGASLAPTLRESLALVATADVVFTPDTAIAHMASAFERPTVTMLRRGFERWVPYRTPGRNVFGSSPDTLDALDVEPVAVALLAVLSETSSLRPAS
jgi:ADP-heptose:LPS heptosyltransferase